MLAVRYVYLAGGVGPYTFGRRVDACLPSSSAQPLSMDTLRCRDAGGKQLPVGYQLAGK